MRMRSLWMCMSMEMSTKVDKPKARKRKARKTYRKCVWSSEYPAQCHTEQGMRVEVNSYSEYTSLKNNNNNNNKRKEEEVESISSSVSHHITSPHSTG